MYGLFNEFFIFILYFVPISLFHQFIISLFHILSYKSIIFIFYSVLFVRIT